MSPTTIINDYLKDEDYAVFKHRFRNSSLEELKFVIKHKVDSKSLLKSQLKEYKKNSELEKYGLYELPTFIKAKIHSQTIFHLCGGSKLQNIRQEIRLVFLMFAASCSTLQNYYPGLLLERVLIAYLNSSISLSLIEAIQKFNFSNIKEANKIKVKPTVVTGMLNKFKSIFSKYSL